MYVQSLEPRIIPTSQFSNSETCSHETPAFLSNFRLRTLPLPLRIQFLNLWIPHHILHTVLTPISWAIRMIRHAIIKVADLVKLLRHCFHRRHAILMWEVYAARTLPARRREPAGARFVEAPMVRLRAVFTAEQRNERSDVVGAEGLHFGFRTDGARHVRACAWGDGVDEDVVFLAFARKGLGKADYGAFLLWLVNVSALRGIGNVQQRRNSPDRSSRIYQRSR